MVDRDSINHAIRMQGYALLLMGMFPASLKKKLLYQLLNELGIKLSKEELLEIEEFYKPWPVINEKPTILRPQKPFRTPIFCPSCGRSVKAEDESLLCSKCGEHLGECTCDPVTPSL